MSPEEYLALYEKYLAGETSPEEEKALYAYPDPFRMHAGHPNGHDLEMKDRVYRQLIRETEEAKSPRKRWWYAAASVLLIGSISLYWYHGQERSAMLSQQMTNTQALVKPGKNVATLTLADGSIIPLDEILAGKIAAESGINITKTEDGQLIYRSLPTSSGEPPVYHRISTPRGGQYQVILPDGSKVWLNAASSIRYPTAFSGSERKVLLKGEAYFEIAKVPSSPFRVVTGKQEIEVLGTHFNVSDYDESPRAITTVLEGAVRVNKVAARQIGQSGKILYPGQQSNLSEDNSVIQVTQVDVEPVVGWKNGYFIFDDDPIPEIMDQIARWYDVEVIYQGNMRGKVFGGSYARNKNLQELLKGLELTEAVHFKIEGRKVIVMP